jgi:hypothetical protein
MGNMFKKRQNWKKTYRVSTFQKEVDNRKEYASEVLFIAFTLLY